MVQIAARTTARETTPDSETAAMVNKTQRGKSNSAAVASLHPTCRPQQTSSSTAPSVLKIKPLQAEPPTITGPSSCKWNANALRRRANVLPSGKRFGSSRHSSPRRIKPSTMAQNPTPKTTIDAIAVVLRELDRSPFAAATARESRPAWHAESKKGMARKASESTERGRGQEPGKPYLMTTHNGKCSARANASDSAINNGVHSCSESKAAQATSTAKITEAPYRNASPRKEGTLRPRSACGCNRSVLRACSSSPLSSATDSRTAGNPGPDAELLEDRLSKTDISTSRSDALEVDDTEPLTEGPRLRAESFRCRPLARLLPAESSSLSSLSSTRWPSARPVPTSRSLAGSLPACATEGVSDEPDRLCSCGLGAHGVASCLARTGVPSPDRHGGTTAMSCSEVTSTSTRSPEAQGRCC
mmetsp:Transcript_69808/g.185876  ORF Transcript_69808/g.185876 Transcript_69808/m.185876 type:complete len:416 (-) Transcript_69808:1049-2296(-)